MLIKILVVVAVVFAAFIIFVATRPAAFSIQRSTTIAASPETVFSQVNDFHAWDAWSPWARRDPNMKTTYEGPDAGEGASYAWQGNNEVGQGKMTITSSQPNELVRIRLEFLKPMKATNTAEFTFVPEGEQTRVTWSMTGENNFVGKAFSVFMNMDKMVGGDFETGLSQMKAVAEAKG